MIVTGPENISVYDKIPFKTGFTVSSLHGGGTAPSV
jgi:hypothetical protein